MNDNYFNVRGENLSFWDVEMSVSECTVASSPSFRRELPTSKVAGRTSMGLNSLRPEGTLSFMLSHLTLRMQARMKQYAIRPLSLLSASGQINILREIVTFSLVFIPYLAKEEFPLANDKTLETLL